MIPFKPCDLLTHLDCSMSRIRSQEKEGFRLEYCLSGQVSAIRYPAPATSPGRKWNLWEHTCLEFFIAEAGNCSYYEVNLSPSGDWNSFVFSDTRKDMREATDLEVECLVTRADKDSMVLTADLLFACNCPQGSLDINMSAVIESGEGRLHYLAISHPDHRPDFHNRKFFRRVQP